MAQSGTYLGLDLYHLRAGTILALEVELRWYLMGGHVSAPSCSRTNVGATPTPGFCTVDCRPNVFFASNSILRLQARLAQEFK